jgi:hypothetical protein
MVEIIFIIELLLLKMMPVLFLINQTVLQAKKNGHPEFAG